MLQSTSTAQSAVMAAYADSCTSLEFSCCYFDSPEELSRVKEVSCSASLGLDLSQIIRLAQKQEQRRA